jgi:glycine/betaine/sarcosine/D-proline reductase family selenoprotein B
MVGANRILRGVAITNPFGAPDQGNESEKALRRRIVERAFEMLETEVAPTTIWDVETNDV